jgi:hypothetical protein
MFLGMFRRSIAENYEGRDLKESFETFNDGRGVTIEGAKRMVSGGIDSSALRRIFDECDGDLDGVIRWAEYPEFVREVQREYIAIHAHRLV